METFKVNGHGRAGLHQEETKPIQKEIIQLDDQEFGKYLTH
jgi:hypothetical protein